MQGSSEKQSVKGSRHLNHQADTGKILFFENESQTKTICLTLSIETNNQMFSYE